MKKEIKRILTEHANDDGLPVFGEDEWIDFTGGYKTDRQELVKDVLAEYIVENRPSFPYREISKEKAEKSFRRLLDSAEDLKIEKGERKVEIRGEHVLKYNFDDYGLYAIQMGHSNNAVSDYFHNSTRVKCQSHDQKNPALHNLRRVRNAIALGLVILRPDLRVVRREIK